MTKQEMAEWLAEKVLGWVALPDFKGMGLTKPGVGLFVPKEINQFIDSPDGMDAVWDALDKRRGDGWSTIFKAYENGNFICTFEFRMNPICMGKGKTRREAFYNAVYQVRKENK